MSQGVLNLQMMGRFGNMALQYCAARAIAERDNLELRTPRWVGEKIFAGVPVTAEPDYSGDFMRGYHQNQDAAIYTLTQVREWFRFQPWIVELIHDLCGHKTIVAHLRRGDMAGYGYPLVSLASYYTVCIKNSLNADAMCFVSEEIPTVAAFFADEVSWLPDFYTMANAKTLLRANSTFSFVAGMINPNRVFSPVITGLEGGKEHLCEFRDDNSAKLCNLDGFTDLHIKP